MAFKSVFSGVKNVVQSASPVFGAGIAALGTRLKLPEFGISEFIGQPSRLTAGKLLATTGQVLNAPELGLSERFGVRSPLPQPGYVPMAARTQAPFSPPFPTSQPQPQPQPQRPIEQLRNLGVPAVLQQQQQQQAPAPEPFTVPTAPPGPNLELIETDYQRTLGDVAAEEARLQGELPLAVGETERAGTRTRAALEQERGGRLARITGREQEQQAATTGALEQLRQLFRETERRQLAQLSAAGITRSSVSEALAALLGREMAQRVSGQQGTRDEVLRGLAGERRRTEDYFGTRLSELEQETADRVQQANLQFRDALAKLGAVRGQAAVARQQARADLFNQFQQQVFQIQQANLQAKQAMEQFRQQIALRLAAAQQTAVNLPDVQAQIAELGPFANQIGLVPTGLRTTGRGPIVSFGRRPAGEITNPFELPEQAGGF